MHTTLLRVVCWALVVSPRKNEICHEEPRPRLWWVDVNVRKFNICFFYKQKTDVVCKKCICSKINKSKLIIYCYLRRKYYWFINVQNLTEIYKCPTDLQWWFIFVCCRQIFAVTVTVLSLLCPALCQDTSGPADWLGLARTQPYFRGCVSTLHNSLRHSPSVIKFSDISHFFFIQLLS